MKLIDADKPLALIDAKVKELGLSGSTWATRNALLVLRSDITSLQQDKEDLDIEMCSEYWWEERGWIMIPPNTTLKGIESLLEQVKKKLQQEQPEVDLEKEIDKEWAKCEPVDEGMGLESANIVNEQFDSIARHFYELGLNARKI